MNFAIRITNLCRYLVDEKHEHRISDLLFRSGTSESLFWLTLLNKTGFLSTEQYKSIYEDCEELKRLLVSITKTSKFNLDNETNN